MMKWFRRLILAIRVTPVWIRARDLAADKKYAEAKKKLSKYRYRGGPIGAGYLLLSALVDIRLGEYSSARRTIAEARRTIQYDQQYSDGEKNYLQCYCDVLIGFDPALRNQVSEEEFQGDWRALDQTAVREHLKLNHPIRVEGGDDD